MTIQEDQSFDARLKDALHRSDVDIHEHHPETDVSPQAEQPVAVENAGIMRIGLEFASGTIVGFLIGWGLDKYFDTLPWCLLIFTILGFAAGMMNVYRTINQMDDAIGLNRRNVLTDKGKPPTS